MLNGDETLHVWGAHVAVVKTLIPQQCREAVFVSLGRSLHLRYWAFTPDTHEHEYSIRPATTNGW